MRISDWSSDVCSSDLTTERGQPVQAEVEDRLHLRLRQAVGRGLLHLALDRLDEADIGGDLAHRPFAREQRLARRRRIGRAADDSHHFVEVRHRDDRSEEHTSELQSLMRNSYAVFCLKKKKKPHTRT